MRHPSTPGTIRNHRTFGFAIGMSPPGMIRGFGFLSSRLLSNAASMAIIHTTASITGFPLASSTIPDEKWNSLSHLLEKMIRRQ
jgi:hypothetical protein